MKDGKPTRAPLIIYGTMLVMSLITVAVVFVKHSQRVQPYMESKQRRVRPPTPPRTTVLSLNYEAFGPQAMAHKLIGNRWWQWQEFASDARLESFDIKVIVYQGFTEDLLEDFPVIPDQSIDSRYLEYDDAMDYLDARIEEDVQPAITTLLVQTRDSLTAHFE